MDVLLLGFRLVLSGVLVVSGIAKLFDHAGTAAAYDGFHLPARFRSSVATGLPIVELVVAIALIPARIVPISALLATILFAAFSVVVTRSVLRGERVECNCFGQLSAAPTSWWTVGRNVCLTVLAGTTWIQAIAGTPPSFFGRLSASGTIILLGFILCGAAIGGLTFLVFHLWEQQGRLLIRLEAIEAAPDRQLVSAVAIPSPLAATAKPLPALHLTTLDGHSADLATYYAESPLLLLFTDPHCGPCTALMPEVHQWQERYDGFFTIAIVASGEPEAIHARLDQHSIANVLMQEGKDANKALGVVGTPSGVVIDRQGQVRGEVARGAAAIRDLVTGLVRAQGRPTPQPPEPPKPVSRVGQMVPLQPVKGLDGGQRFVGGPSPRGQMLVFWRPDCGYCMRMLDDWKRVEPSWPDDAPELVVVSSGSPESNIEQGIQTLVVLDEGFGVGRSVGARGTPSAIVINRDGRIASEIRLGATAILDAFSHPLDLVP